MGRMWGAKWGARCEKVRRSASDGAGQALSGRIAGKKIPYPLSPGGNGRVQSSEKFGSRSRPESVETVVLDSEKGKRFLGGAISDDGRAGKGHERGQFIFHRPARESPGGHLPAGRGRISKRFLRGGEVGHFFDRRGIFVGGSSASPVIPGFPPFLSNLIERERAPPDTRNRDRLSRGFEGDWCRKTRGGRKGGRGRFGDFRRVLKSLTRVNGPRPRAFSDDAP